MPATSVRRATRADTDAIAVALADAFADDPVFGWLVPPSAHRRTARLRRFFNSTAKSYLRSDLPILVAGDGQGAALWLPPGTPAMTAAESVRELIPMARVFRGGLARASRLYAQLLKLHPATPPHWYLYCIGTRSDSQGQGLGSAMLREVLDRADEAGEAAYLESSNARNLPLYQRHGFTVVEVVQIEGEGPTMWRMWRNPAT